MTEIRENALANLISRVSLRANILSAFVGGRHWDRQRQKELRKLSKELRYLLYCMKEDLDQHNDEKPMNVRDRSRSPLRWKRLPVGAMAKGGSSVRIVNFLARKAAALVMGLGFKIPRPSKKKL